MLDVDGAAGATSIEGKVIPPTWTAKTGRGQHIWFKHPGGTVPNFAHGFPAWTFGATAGTSSFPECPCVGCRVRLVGVDLGLRLGRGPGMACWS